MNANPILQMLNNPQSNNILSKISQIQNMMNGMDPDKLYSQMIRNNPQFRKFVEANKGKTPEQIAQENGIDFNLLK